MKKIIFGCLAAALCSCGNSNYSISGKYPLTPGDSVFLFDSRDSVIASGVVGSDTTFLIKGKVSTPEIARLFDGERTHTPVLIFIEPGAIRVDPGQGGNSRVSGTPLNDSLMLMNEKLQALREAYLKMKPETPKEEVEALLERFSGIPREQMNANPDNLLGLYLFTTYELPACLQDSTRFTAVKTYMDGVSAELRAHPMMKSAEKQLSGFENSRIGCRFTELVLQNAGNETIALSSMVRPGRWVLLDFWATWCAPCVSEIPYLKQAWIDFKDKGFEIYAVSLDNDRARWQNFVTEGDMPWINVLGVDNDKQSEAAAVYGIRSIPSNFLISPQGVIVLKNLRGENLRVELEKRIR